MPELPEVEVVRRTLAPGLVGERVAAVEVRAPALREPLDAGALRRDLEGRLVEGLRRRGKYLLVDLEGGRTLALHLGMTGQLTLTAAGPERPPEPHEHVVFRLASGRSLRFRDPRRFGLAFTAATAALEADPHFAHLGVEPLGSGFSGRHLAAAASRRRGPVKPFLMDATVVVGVGNIYASEALVAAAIHPRRSVARISAARWERLAGAVRDTLRRAIEEGGTSLSDFVDGEGRAGAYQISLAVYDREGRPCPRCGAPIRRFVQAGRSTYHCPRCQR